MRNFVSGVSAGMRFRADDESLRPGSRRVDGLIRIDRGAYLDPRFLPDALAPWEAARAVTMARCYAVERKRRQRSKRLVISGEAALAAAGLGTWNAAPTITYRSAAAQGPNVELPSVLAWGHRVRGVRVMQVRGSVRAHGKVPAPAECPSLASVAEVVADCAAHLPAHAAYANVSGLFSTMTCFKNWSQPECRAAERELKEELQAVLASSTHVKHAPRMRALVDLADAGAGSILEGAFLWMLHCLLKPNVAWETQFEARISGSTYFCDAAIPDLKICLECDGASKMGDTPLELNKRSQAFLARQQAFTNAGWSVVRMTGADFKNVGVAVRKLSAALAPFGVLRAFPGGRLWQVPDAQ